MTHTAVNALPEQLYRAALAFTEAGIPIAMTTLSWDLSRGKKVMVRGREPVRDWQNRPLLSAADIMTFVRQGANAYLYRLPDGVWVLDSDTPESVQWAQRFGPALCRTPRGEHRLFRGPTRIVLPPGLPETSSDLAVRQLYGPGSYYDTPDRGTVVYAGSVPDFARLPEIPPELRGSASATPPAVSAENTGISPNVVISDNEYPKPAATPVDGFFGGPGVTPTQARALAAAKLAAIEAGPLYGESARSGIRDAALFLGGLLHTGWFIEEQARDQVLAACGRRWPGGPNEDDAKWVDQGLRDGIRKPLAVTAEQVVALGKDGRPATGLRDRLYTPDELAARTPPEPLIDGLIDVASLGMVYGPGGSGKSFAALGMACSVSLGVPWHGHATKQGAVLYVAGEGASGIAGRIAAWQRSSGAPHVGVDVLHGALDIFSPTGQSDRAELIELINERHYVMVVFDTYNRCTPGLNENDSKDTGIVIRNLSVIQQTTNAAVLIVHHTPKNGDSPRGSAALEWATDHAISVVKDGAAVTVTNARQKDREDGQQLHLALVGEQGSGSAYLVESQQRFAGDPTHGAAAVRGEDAYDAFDTRPLGPELDGFTGRGHALLRPLALMMAQRAADGSVGISRSEATKYLGRKPGDGVVRDAWNVLWRAGALTPVNQRGSTTHGAAHWVPAELRSAELARRLC